MEIANGFKYSKVAAQEMKQQQENSQIPARAWRSVKKVASRFMRRRRKLVGGISRRVVLWGCGQIKRKVMICNCSCRIPEAKIRRNDGDDGGQVSGRSYDILSYSRNFDDGDWQQQEVEFYSRRSFSYRFVQPNNNIDSL